MGLPTRQKSHLKVASQVLLTPTRTTYKSETIKVMIALKDLLATTLCHVCESGYGPDSVFVVAVTLKQATKWTTVTDN